MSAPDHAIPLWKENKKWKKNKWRVHCENCGWKGLLNETLVVEEEDMSWWPICGSSGWVYD